MSTLDTAIAEMNAEADAHMATTAQLMAKFNDSAQAFAKAALACASKIAPANQVPVAEPPAPAPAPDPVPQPETPPAE